MKNWFSYRVITKSVLVGIVISLQPNPAFGSPPSVSCTQLVSDALKKEEEGFQQADFLTKEEVRFRQKFEFVGRSEMSLARTLYLRGLVSDWADVVSRSKNSRLASHHMGTFGTSEGDVKKAWGFQRNQLLAFLVRLAGQEEITSMQGMAAAWWVASFSAVSIFPGTRWLEQDVLMTFLPVSISKLLEARENAFARYSGAARKRQAAGADFNLMGPPEPYELLPVSIATTFVDMNFIFLRRAFVMGVPLLNRNWFDGFQSYSAAYLGHDDLHAVRASVYEDRLEELRNDYMRGIDVEQDPLLRRLAEFIFYRVWHEEIEFFSSFYRNGEMSDSVRKIFLGNLRKFEEASYAKYLELEMASHAQIFGPEAPSRSQMKAAVDLVMAALSLPRP